MTVDKNEMVEEMIAAGATPLEPYTGINSAWKCRCNKCKRVIGARIRSVRKGSPACGYCGGWLTDPKDAEKEMKAAGVIPLEPYTSSKTPWKCRCKKCKQTVSPSLTTVRSGGGCVYCAGRKVDPEVATGLMQKAGFTPLEPYPGADAPWNCRCNKCKRETTPSWSSIKQGSGCKWCARTVVDPAEAEQVMKDAGVTPLVAYPGVNKKWLSKCNKCERFIEPNYTAVRSGYQACGYCASRRVDLDSQIEFMIVSGFQPLVKYPGANNAWKCRCLKCGHITSPSLSNLKKGAGGCRVCAGLHVDPKEATRVMRAADLIPLVAYPGSSTPWKCRCKKCKREVMPLYLNVRRRGSGCLWCAGKKIDPDEALRQLLAADATPLQPYPGSADKVWKCRCNKCKRTVSAKLETIRAGGGACVHCAVGGYKPNKPGVVYYLYNETHEAYKVGISNVPNARLRDLRVYGWEPLYILEFEQGSDALEVEGRVLIHLRNKWLLDAAVTKDQLPAGWSETFSAVGLQPWKVRRLIDRKADQVLR